MIDQARLWNLVSSRKRPTLFDGRPIFRSTVPGGQRHACSPLLRSLFRAVVRPPCGVAEVEACRFLGGPLELYVAGQPVSSRVFERLRDKAESELAYEAIRESVLSR